MSHHHPQSRKSEFNLLCSINKFISPKTLKFGDFHLLLYYNEIQECVKKITHSFTLVLNTLRDSNEYVIMI